MGHEYLRERSTYSSQEMIGPQASYQECMQSERLHSDKLLLATWCFKYPDRKRLKGERACFGFQFCGNKEEGLLGGTGVWFVSHRKQRVNRK